jgi:TPR repeat protein
MPRLSRLLLLGALFIATWLVGVPGALAVQGRFPSLDQMEADEPQTLERAAAAMKLSPSQTQAHATACHDGDQGACVALGVDYALGVGLERNAQRALELYRGGCAQKVQIGCVLEGWALVRDPATKDRRGHALIEAACAAGESLGCYTLGLAAWLGKGEPKKTSRAAQVWRKACVGGEKLACTGLAYLLDTGSGAKRDSTEAARLLEQTCKGGDGNACAYLGGLQWKGRGVAVNHVRASELFDEACRDGSSRGCAALGVLRVVEGRTKEARPFLALACSAGDATGCMLLGVWHENFGAVADAVPPLTTACERDQGLACRALGLLYARGRVTNPGKMSSAALFERACDLDDAFGCYNLAIEREHRGDYAAAAAPVRKACKLDPDEQCGELARLAFLGKGMPRDTALSLNIWRKACDSGEAEGCSGLALAHEQGVGVKLDLSKAASLYRKACDKNSANACGLLAEFVRDGKGVPRDLAGALALFERSCSGGEGVSCVHAGLAYQNGDGVPADAVKALAFFTRACSAGAGSGCANAGFYLRDTKRDSKGAFALFEKGCALADTGSCLFLSDAYELGDPVPKDLARAKALNERACTAGNPSGFLRLAHRIMASKSVLDYPRARALSDTACRARLAHGCHILGALLRDGLGGPKDSARSGSLLKGACDEGDKDACGTAAP